MVFMIELQRKYLIQTAKVSVRYRLSVPKAYPLLFITLSLTVSSIGCHSTTVERDLFANSEWLSGTMLLVRHDANPTAEITLRLVYPAAVPEVMAPGPTGTHRPCFAAYILYRDRDMTPQVLQVPVSDPGRIWTGMPPIRLTAGAKWSWTVVLTPPWTPIDVGVQPLTMRNDIASSGEIQVVVFLPEWPAPSGPVADYGVYGTVLMRSEWIPLIK